MHEAYWGLTESPFGMTPDPRFLYMAHTHEDALMMVHYAITRNKGLAVVYGEIGTGKTILSRKIMDLFDPVRNKCVSVVNPVMTPVQFLSEILTQLDTEPSSTDLYELSKQLHGALTSCYDRGQRVVLLVDDAHQMKTDGVMEQIGFLLRWQMNDQFLVNVLLLGNSTLSAKIDEVPELSQQAAVRFQLQPLSLPETGDLLLHRLRAAGYTGPSNPFTAESIFEIHRFTKGIPRLICQVADNALLLGMSRKFRVIDDVVMHQVTDEFYGLEQAA